MNINLDSFVSAFFSPPSRPPSQPQQLESRTAAVPGPVERPTPYPVDVVGAAARAQAIAKFTAWQLEASQSDPSLASPNPTTQNDMSDEGSGPGRIAVMTSSAVRAAYSEN